MKQKRLNKQYVKLGTKAGKELIPVIINGKRVLVSKDIFDTAAVCGYPLRLAKDHD